MKIILTTIASDSHTWNLVFMQLFLEELGHQVINLGCCVPIDLLLQQVRQHCPDMIVVSSINGHANIEGVDIAKAIRSCDVSHSTYLVIGGKLGTRGAANSQYYLKLKDAGYDGVFSGDQDLSSFTDYLSGINNFLQNKVRLVA